MGTRIRVSDDYIIRGRAPGEVRDERTAYLRKTRRDLIAAQHASQDKSQSSTREMVTLLAAFVLAFTLMGYFFG